MGRESGRAEPSPVAAPMSWRKLSRGGSRVAASVSTGTTGVLDVIGGLVVVSGLAVVPEVDCVPSSIVVGVTMTDGTSRSTSSCSDSTAAATGVPRSTTDRAPETGALRPATTTAPRTTTPAPSPSRATAPMIRRIGWSDAQGDLGSVDFVCARSAMNVGILGIPWLVRQREFVALGAKCHRTASDGP